MVGGTSILTVVASSIRSGPTTDRVGGVDLAVPGMARTCGVVVSLAGGNGDLTTRDDCNSSGSTAGRSVCFETSGHALGNLMATTGRVGGVDLLGPGMARSCEAVVSLAGGSGDLTVGVGCISSGPTAARAGSSETSGHG